MHKTATTYLQFNFLPSLIDTTVYHPYRFYDRIGTQALKRNFIISNEGMSGVAWNDKWLLGKINDHHWIDSFSHAIENCRKLYPHAEIIIVFRRHGDLLISMYKQYVQEGGTLPFEKFYGEHGVINQKDLHFSTRLHLLQTAFKKVYALSFEDIKQYKENYFIKFFDFCGIAADPDKIRSTFSNESISGVKIEILRRINTVYCRFPKAMRKGLNRVRLTPRHILQRRLRFWKPRDNERMITVAHDVNQHFDNDWESISKYFWRYNE
jgi:hypothetical protein